MSKSCIKNGSDLMKHIEFSGGIVGELTPCGNMRISLASDKDHVGHTFQSKEVLDSLKDEVRRKATLKVNS